MRDYKTHGRRDLRQLDLPEERVEIADPLLEGKAARIGTEESTELRWKRGGFVRVVFVRIKYDSATPAAAPASDARSDGAAVAPAGAAARNRHQPACTREKLAALVASDPRTAGAVIVTAPMPPRLLARSFATPSLVAHVASDKFCDGLPLNRQEDRFARLGVPIDRGTMCRWLEEAGATVGATIVEAMRREALATAHCIATGKEEPDRRAGVGHRRLVDVGRRGLRRGAERPHRHRRRWLRRQALPRAMEPGGAAGGRYTDLVVGLPR
jgi:transposase